MKNALLAVAAGLALVAATVAGPADARADLPRPVTVVLVRHAETAESTRTARDPELSERGRARAAALDELLAHAGVTHLFSSPLARTRATLGPLAARTGLAVRTIDPRATDSWVEALTGLPEGSVAVVAGHSNTVPALVRALGASGAFEEHPEHGPLLDHDEYDRLFLVTLPAAAGASARAVELRYGGSE